MPDFVNLHHHDEYSIKDGLGTVEQLADLIKSRGGKYLAVTNHGSIGGWIRQANACKNASLKPIYGMEAYMGHYRGDDPELKKANKSANHLILLARTEEGMKNIIAIHNDAQINGFYYTPRASLDFIADHGAGIIGTSSCMGGELSEFLMAGELEKAVRLAKFYNSVFDKFYIELQIIEAEDQREANRRLISLAKSLSLPMTIACDSHYLKKEHADTHDLLLCIRQQRTIKDQREKDDVWRFSVRNLYYRSYEEMEDVYLNGFIDESGVSHAGFIDDVFTREIFDAAIENTVKISESIEEIKFDSSLKLPKVVANSADVLREKCNNGFIRLGLDKRTNSKEYRDRLEYELSVIEKMGFVDYFLIVEDYVNAARKEFGDYSVGPGRGSGAGCLIAWCCDITRIDPVELKLVFERFISVDRTADPPDLDIDFDPSVRDWVKEYITKKYGKGHVCAVGTYTTYKTRAVILDVARALGLDVHEAMVVTKEIDTLETFEDESDNETKVDKLPYSELVKHYVSLGNYFNKYPEVLRHCNVLRNQIKNNSTHAGGVIVSNINLIEGVPLFVDKSGRLVSMWAESGNFTELSSVGLVKLDILGVMVMPIIKDCVNLIEKNHGKKLYWADIPIDDREAILCGSKRDFVGIFQFENAYTKKIADLTGVDSLNDLSAITSLIRPGPKDVGLDVEYASRKNGKEFSIPAPLVPILGPTYGILVYQEQSMFLAREVAGFTMAEANKLRKAIGKKKPELMAQMKDKFIDGGRKKAVADGWLVEDEVISIWNLIESQAGYAFCASHSFSYSAISAVELWLKHHYLTEFMTALLTNTDPGKEKFGEDVLVGYLKYARQRELDVKPPSVNKSGKAFRTEGIAGIRYGLGHVRNVSNSADIIEKNQPYSSLRDFIDRTASEVVLSNGKTQRRKLNTRVVESLIAAGALSDFGNRDQLTDEWEKIKDGKKVKTVAVNPNEGLLFGDDVGREAVTTPVLIKKEESDKWIKLEEEMIGVSLSLPDLSSVHSIECAKMGWRTPRTIKSDTRKRVKIFGKVVSMETKPTKSGNMIMRVILTDHIFDFQFYVFQGDIDSFKDNAKKGRLVVVPIRQLDGNRGYSYDSNKESVVML